MRRADNSYLTRDMQPEYARTDLTKWATHFWLECEVSFWIIVVGSVSIVVQNFYLGL
jgi:hypothetical protein